MASIQHLAEQIGASPWLNVASFVVGIVGFILAFVFYFRAKREKIPQYQIRTFRLIEDNVSEIPALKILYDNKPVENLTLTRISIWNRGADPIEFNDIAPLDRLRVELENSFKLLGAEIFSVNTPTNNFSLSTNLEKRVADLQFEYFGKNEGVVLNIFHTGKQNSDLRILGTIKGAGNISHFSKDRGQSDRFVRSVSNYLEHLFPKNSLGQTIVVILFILFLVLMSPILLPLASVEYVFYIFQRPPKCFLLE
jgi:hypothetical protein